MIRRSMDLAADIKPISEVRANTSSIVKQVQTSGRPVVITQNGRSAAVLVDVDTYQEMVDRLELGEDIEQARDESRKERSTHASFMDELKRRHGG